MAFLNVARTICDFDISALAEWGWDAGGRSEYEFAIARAARAGIRQPELVAEWAELMGPVEWDVYDSDFAEKYAEGRAVL